MELTKQQISALQAKGLDKPTIEKLANEKGYTMPKQTDFLDKAASISGKLFPGAKVGEAIGKLGGYGYTLAKDKIQGTNNAQFYDLNGPTPLQVGGDILAGAASIAGARIPGASSLLGKAGQFGALGATAGAGSAIADKKSAGEVAGQATRGGVLGILTGLTFGIAEKAARGVGNFLGNTGQKIQTTVIKPSQTDIKDGFNIQTLRKYNLGGSLQDTMQKTDARLDTLSTELNKKLAQSNSSINMNNVYQNTTNRLFGDKFAGFGSNTQLSNAAQKLRDEIVYSTGPNGIATVPEAQVIKRAAGHYGAWQYGAQDPEAKASERVYNLFYSELKNEIERSSPPGVRDLNKQMSELIPVMNAVIRRIPIAERNRGLSLTDIISLTGATLDPRALAVTGLNFAQKSGKVGNVLSKAPALGQSVSDRLGATEQTAKAIFPNTR